ncbi:MAG TPA: efflux RND transporter periplasmic adaptor subunit [Vicinamibacterales bacterium]|nr:efflux RND transporter periplasmic adaptor subunit [Vicinamibacterales bacterium]
MKKLILIVVVVIAVGVGAGAYYMKRGAGDPQISTLQVTRGDIVQTVGATGTLQAVTTVQVGAQVSGTISWLGADFNSIVHKGQLIAKLDPALMQTALDTANANLVKAQADLQRLQVALEDAKVKDDQAHALSAKSLIPETDLQTADVNFKQAQASLKSQQAQVEQAKTSVANAQVNVDHTIIKAPIDGIITQRSVDVGQTVASSFQAPVLFIIAADLTKMQVLANIDESDVGNIRPNQTVSFHVDAYPTQEFTGSVSQIRLNPTVVQNVVTYSTVINVPNPSLKLMPGMTANLNIEVARRSNALRVPNAALRFRPTQDTFLALDQALTPDIQRAIGMGRGRGGFRGRAGANGQTARNGDASAAFQRGGGDNPEAPMTPEERQKRMQDRMANMTPEQRQQFMDRMKNRPGGAGAAPATTAETKTEEALGKAATIDSLFGPLPTVETRGRVWLYINKQLKPVSLRLGITDGTWTEVLDNKELQPNTDVVTNVVTGLESTSARPAGASGNPLMGPQRGRGRGR